MKDTTYPVYIMPENETEGCFGILKDGEIISYPQAGWVNYINQP